MEEQHKVEYKAEYGYSRFCSCGEDSCVCQTCGKAKCVTETLFADESISGKNTCKECNTIASVFKRMRNPDKNGRVNVTSDELISCFTRG